MFNSIFLPVILATVIATCFVNCQSVCRSYGRLLSVNTLTSSYKKDILFKESLTTLASTLIIAILL